MLNKKRKKWMICLLCAALLASLCACASKGRKPDPGAPDPELSSKPLEFFDCSFHDEEGFTFDGFPLMADYKIIEERMKLTETEVEPYVRESEGMYGEEQYVNYFDVSVEGYPEAKADVTYNFFKKQFICGSMKIEFPDYESARQYAKEKAGALWSLQKEGLEEERNKEDYKGMSIGEGEEGYTYMARNIDERDVYIQISASMDAWQKGIVTISLQENTMDIVNDSIYFVGNDSGSVGVFCLKNGSK